MTLRGVGLARIPWSRPKPRLLSQLAPVVTQVAPYVRDEFNLGRLRNYTVLALLPSILMGLYTTGRQASLSIAQLAPERTPGWRTMLLERSGIGIDPSSVTSVILHGLLFFVPIFAVAVVFAQLWERLFARLRERPRIGDCSLTPLIFTLMLPPSAPLWQVALGVSFGVVLGREVFGGIGKNFLNPALVGLAFLALAYPNALSGDRAWTGIAGYGGTSIFNTIAAEGMGAFEQAGTVWWQSFLGLTQGSLAADSALASVLGAGFLIYRGVISWRIVSAVILSAVATSLFFNSFSQDAGPLFALPWYWHLTLGSFAFGASFLATDQTSAPLTDQGGWIYGFLIGFMVVLIRVANPVHPDGVVLAILFGNVFAPLIDSFVIWTNIRRRVKRSA